MKDLTTNSIEHHILTLAAPVAVGMVTQVAYQLINLYFITRIGVAATAGVSAASSITYCIAALAQVLAVGSAPLIAQALGRKDRLQANIIFNQSLALSACCSLVIAPLLYLSAPLYLHSIAADSAAVTAGIGYMLWLTPGLALMLPTAAFGSALRSGGAVAVQVTVSTVTVTINAILTPFLIAGWGTGVALGAQGAGLATSIASAAGFLLLAAYFSASSRYLTVRLALLRPRSEYCRRIVALGFPAGAEFVFTFLSMAVMYYAIRELGAVTQAGFGIVSRIWQLIALPGMAIGFAAAPIAAQNFGAENFERVRETFKKTAIIAMCVMAAITVAVQCWPRAFVMWFDADAAVVAVATSFLHALSWAFVPQGLAYVCSNMFQGLGNTVPSLLGSLARFSILCTGTALLSVREQFAVDELAYTLVASVLLQAALSALLLRIELRRRLFPTRVARSELSQLMTVRQPCDGE